MEKTRIISIDIAKAICIILVAAGHFMPDYAPNWYVVVSDILRAFRMPFFLFISGYLHWATRKPVGYKDFVWKKFQRLMIPYFFVSAIIIIIKLLTGDGLALDNPITWSAFYEMFYFPVAGYFLWFVFALFLMFLIIPFFNTRKRLLVLLALALVGFFVPLSLPKVFCSAEFQVYLLYFVLGCAFAEWINLRKLLDKTHFLLLLCVFAVLYALKVQSGILELKKLMVFFTALAGFILVLNLSEQIEEKTTAVKKILLNVSVCSYTIYLFHTTFEGFFKAILMKIPFLVNNSGNQFVFLFIALIVVSAGIIIPIIIHEIIIRYSKLFSYLIGTKFSGNKNTIPV